jgi:cholest-4-en-3-one 26-monooxygenase
MPLDDIDLTDLDIFERQVPHEWFRRLRSEAPVHWHEEKNGPGFWAITKYADVKAISSNPTVFSSELRGALAREPEEETMGFMRSIMLNMDPPRHRQYRALVSRAFTPRRISNIGDNIKKMVREIINGVIEKGECDFVEDIAALLPLRAICEMMGVPEEDRRSVYVLGNRMVGIDDPEMQPDGKPMVQTDGMGAAGEMFMYAGHLWEKAHSNPGDDLATALVNAEVDGHRLTETEFNFFFLLLIIAGNETTRTVTSNGMLALLQHADQLQALRDDPGLVNSAVEEILRYAPAVHNFRRTATGDTEIRGRKIRANHKLVMWYPSANRDEDVFHEPDDFNIRRSPNDHLAFGIGEHYCLGANLARLELQEMFRGLVLRLHDIEQKTPARRLRSTFINGVKEMPIRFRAGPIE